jgi:hypothetical protein
LKFKLCGSVFTRSLRKNELVIKQQNLTLEQQSFTDQDHHPESFIRQALFFSKKRDHSRWHKILERPYEDFRRPFSSELEMDLAAVVACQVVLN